jgi:VanZ family protein
MSDAKREISRWKFWRLACAALAILMVFSLFYIGSKPVAVGLFPTPWDKVAHGLFFSVLATMSWIVAGNRKPWLIAIAVVVVGGLDELHQISLPGRSADWADFFADVVAGVGMVCMLMLRKAALRN